MAIQTSIMAKSTRKKVRQNVKSLWKVLLAQQEIIASEGEKDIRAKSKGSIKMAWIPDLEQTNEQGRLLWLLSLK